MHNASFRAATHAMDRTLSCSTDRATGVCDTHHALHAAHPVPLAAVMEVAFDAPPQALANALLLAPCVSAIAVLPPQQILKMVVSHQLT